MYSAELICFFKTVKSLLHLNGFQQEICCHLFFNNFFFPLVAIKVPFFITSFITSCFDYDVPWFSFTSVSYAWGSLSFLDLWVLLFIKNGNSSAIASSNIFFFPLSFLLPPFAGTSIIYVSGHLRLTCRLLMLWFHQRMKLGRGERVTLFSVGFIFHSFQCWAFKSTYLFFLCAINLIQCFFISYSFHL